ncbi:MAG: quinone-dependent dihydroorotate dehydrogenase [Hyphomonadaceae bacterium]
MSKFDLAARLARKLPPETAHLATIRALKAGLGPRGVRIGQDPILQSILPRSKLGLMNPVGLAAGFDKNADVFQPMLNFGFGFVECGTVTPRPQPGNPRPRLFRLIEDMAVINRMGFNNHGLDYFVRRLRVRPQRMGKVGANVGANKDSEDRIADYVIGIKAVWDHCDYITINVSSPNTPGLRGLQDKGALGDLLGQCSEAVTDAQTANPEALARPVFLKLAPDLDDAAIGDIISVVRGSFLAGLIISNTTLDRSEALRSTYKSETGGLSGEPLMQKSTEVLRIFAAELKGEMDLIGAGGIASGEDAYAKIRAGAHAVQLYSALVFEGPGLAERIKTQLATCLRADGFKSLAEAVGVDLN